MRAYNNTNVFDAALDRIRYVFDNHPNVYVSSSGGKDSTVVTELALMVAKEKNRLPLNVAFLDQESEYEATVDYMRKLYNRPDIKLHWFQFPFRLSNATTTNKDEEYLHCWNPAEENKWIRSREPYSIHENPFKVDRYHALVSSMGLYIFNNEPSIALVGMRAAESLARYAMYHKVNTIWHDKFWVSRNKYGGLTATPIIDWELSDVWHAICINKWAYNSIYNKMFQYGVADREMRVSSIIHETGVHALKILKILEPHTFEKLSLRIGGINTYNLLHKQDLYSMKKLPNMFSCWKEYRDYLLDTICHPENKQIMLRMWNGLNTEADAKNQVSQILLNDISGTKNANKRASRKLLRKIHDGRY